MTEPVLELLRTEFAAIDDVLPLLQPEDWDRPSECPTWSVKDNLAHINGIEAMLLGRDRSGPIEPQPDHVKNALGALNESDVVERRDRDPNKLVDEYRELVAERLKVLEAWGDADWASETMTPVGMGTQRDMIGVRILDLYYHEQDMRRGAGLPGHHDGPVPEFVGARMRRTVPRSLVKGAGVRPGSVVAFDLTAGPVDPFAVEVRDDRRGYETERPPDPRVAFTFTTEAFLRFCGGRWDVTSAIADGLVAVDGDTDLGRRILENLAATP